VFCEIDADRQPATHQQYGVSALPTIIFMDKDGKALKTVVGGMSLAEFIQTMDAVKASAG